MFLSLLLTFQGFTDDPDVARFKDTDIAEEFEPICQRWFNRAQTLDAAFGTYMHDITVSERVLLCQLRRCRRLDADLILWRRLKGQSGVKPQLSFERHGNL